MMLGSFFVLLSCDWCYCACVDCVPFVLLFVSCLTSGVCYVCVFFHCVCKAVGPLVCHGVGGGKGDGDVAGLVSV